MKYLRGITSSSMGHFWLVHYKSSRPEISTNDVDCWNGELTVFCNGLLDFPSSEAASCNINIHSPRKNVSFFFSFTCGCPHPSPLEYHPRLHHKSLCSACEDDLFLCLAIECWHESVLCTRVTWGNGSTSPCCSSALLLEAGILKHRIRTWKPRWKILIPSGSCTTWSSSPVSSDLI